MRRISISVAVLTVALVGLVAAPAGAGGGHGDGDMDMGGHGSGRDKNAPVAADARKIKVTATSFEFTPEEITIPAGEGVAIVLTSKDVFHDFVVKGVGHVVGAKKGKTRRGGLMLDEPGTYKFWCSVTGHRGAGMKGTIVVE